MNIKRLEGSSSALALLDESVDYPRVLDMWGPDVVKFELPIPENYEDDDKWALTATNTGTPTNHTTAGQRLLITTSDTDFDGLNMQALGTPFDLAAGKPLYFGIECSISSATQSDFLVGLAGTDTALMAASGSHAMNIGAGFVGFYKLDAVTDIYAATYKTTAANNVASVGTMDTDAHKYEFWWDGSTLSVYFDGERMAVFTDDLPTVALTPSICFRTGSAAAITMSVATWRVSQARS
jgi:hypothetical protein